MATIEIDKHVYKQKTLLIVSYLLADVIIGHDWLKTHSSLTLNLGGNAKPLNICSVMEALLPPASIFTNISQFIKPVAVKSRRYIHEDDIW